MSVGVPGGYRWVSWRPLYTPELVAVLLPMAWGQQPWLNKEEPASRCIFGAGTCTHTCEEDQFDEGCVVDGDHTTCYHRHGGHNQCGKCMCVDPTSRRSNADRESDLEAMRIDIQHAFRKVMLPWEISVPLVLRHKDGLKQREIAEIQGVSQQIVSLRLRAGHMAIADWLNGATV